MQNRENTLFHKLSPRHVLIFEIVAFWSMVIDHLGRAHIFDVPGWQILGRAAFPLFAMCFAYNAATYQRCNTRKLVVIGVLAMPATSFLFDLQWWQPNIMFAFPLGWFVFRYFADKQNSVDALWKPLVLCALVAALSLGPAYDFRGILLIAMLLWFFSNRDVNKSIFLAVCCYLFVVGALVTEPDKIIPTTLLLVLIFGLVMKVPPALVTRNRATWWGRTGFGKWYVLHAYTLCAIKLLGS